jgi:hypothetical protein
MLGQYVSLRVFGHVFRPLRSIIRGEEESMLGLALRERQVAIKVLCSGEESAGKERREK